LLCHHQSFILNRQLEQFFILCLSAVKNYTKAQYCIHETLAVPSIAVCHQINKLITHTSTFCLKVCSCCDHAANMDHMNISQSELSVINVNQSTTRLCLVLHTPSGACQIRSSTTLTVPISDATCVYCRSHDPLSANDSSAFLMMQPKTLLHRISEKNKQNCFVITSSNFHQF